MDGPSILVVDDDAGDRRLLRRLLSRGFEGLRPHEADTTEAALALEAPLDAILLDQCLPDDTGVSVIGKLIEKWPAVAIVLMTGQGNEEVAKSAILAGATDYISKDNLNADSVRRMVLNGIDLARMRHRLEEQRQELGVFSQVLVHDFRAPIRAVAFLANEIVEETANGNLAEVERAGHLLQKSARQMSDLVASLAVHIQVDRERAEFVCTPVSDIVDTALLALYRDIATSGSTVESEVDDVSLKCDAAALSQLIQNLVTNSIKYRSDDVPRILIEATETSESVEIRLTDNGRGIPAEYSDKVFLPFSRLPGSNDVSGTGLGLATCRKVAQRHGGRIFCEPAPEGGTAFVITIPTSARGSCSDFVGPDLS